MPLNWEAGPTVPVCGRRCGFKAVRLPAAGGIEGVSISGGEPFQQPEALEDLLRRLRATPPGILVFSGYTLERIRALGGRRSWRISTF